MKLRLGKALAISLAVSTLISLLFLIGFLSNIQLGLQNNLYGGQKADDGIVIVSIDDESIQKIGRWPWDRKVFAELVQHLKPAKVVGIDVTFFENSSIESDSAFASAVKSAGNVVLPFEFTSFQHRENGEVVGGDSLLPIPLLANSASEIAYVNTPIDADGFARSITMGLSSEYSSFSHAVYRKFSSKEIEFGSQRFLINFASSPGAFNRFKAIDVIEGRVGRNEIANRIVLVGATSPDLQDDYIVPTSNGVPMPGVELHANAIQTMLSGTFLSMQNWLAVILLIFLFSISTAFIFFKKKLFGTCLFAVVAFIGYYFAAVIIFEQFGIILDLVFVPLSIICTFVALVAYGFLFESKHRRFISSAFSKYVSQEVVDELVENPSKLKLGGETAEITIFFSDVRGFTTISERLSPQQLVHLLNDYLSAMTGIVLQNKGLVDKFIGDAIMAFWGAPLKERGHARLACKSALEMVEKLKEINENAKAQNFPELDIGIGLNTGEAVVGNMGSYNRFNYTAMGDSVNLASRLEGLSKEYRTKIIVSEATKREAGTEFIFRELDLVAVKGKKLPVRIFELVGYGGNVTREMLELIRLFEKGLHEYWKQEWGTALRHFQKCFESGDKTAEVFISRCQHYQEHPLPKGWDGVNVMKTK